MSQTADVVGRNAAGALSQPASARTRRNSRLVRPILMLGGVVLLAVAGFAYWLRSGSIVTVDDSYIRAAKLGISTDVSGIVASVSVHEGQVVRTGDVLFRLDEQPFRIAVEGARAAMEQTRLDVAAMKQDYARAQSDMAASEAQMKSDQADYGRFASLLHTGAVTIAETDDARFKLTADRGRLESLRAQSQVLLARLSGDAAIDPAKTPAFMEARSRLDEAQRQLDHAVVRAPFAGVVTQVEAIQPGMYLAASTSAFALVSTDNVWAEGNPKETELTWVKPGDRVDVHVDTYGGRTWSGIVESISPASGSEFSVLPAQNTSGNWVKVVQRVPLRVRLDKQQGAPVLRSGMSAVLSIDTGHTRRLADLLP